MADLKISEMPDGGIAQVSDEIPVNRSNANFKVKVGSGATANIGSDVGDIIVWADDGDGNPVYPYGDGQNIDNILANNVTYNNSINNLPSNNVQGAIDFLYDKTDPLSRIDVPPTYRFQSKPEQDDPLLDFERSTVANRINARGLIQEIDIDVIRHQYDALSGNYLGWLIERQKQNTCLRSNDFSTSPWSVGSRNTLTPNAGPDPFGGNSAWRSELTSMSGAAYNIQAISGFVAGTPETYSVFVPDGGTDTLVFFQSFTSGGGALPALSVQFNLLTGEMTGTGAPTARMRRYASGWRLELTITPVDSGSGNIGWGISTGQALGTWGYFFGAQCEKSSVATSYIPTGATAVTRANDQLSYTLPEAVTEGTIYFEGTDTGGTGGNGVLFSLSDGTSGNTVWVQRATTERITCVVAAGGVEYRLNTANNAVPIGSKIRGAISFRGGQVFASVNGVPVTLAVGTIPTTINPMSILRIGSYGSGANVNNGMISRDNAYYYRALDQDQINRITAI